MTFKMMKNAVALTAAMTALATVPTVAMADEVTGNISVLSSYILRGNTGGPTGLPENTGATLQGGLDYSSDTGFYAGWWTSTLGTDTYGTANPMEHDFYAGYSGSLAEGVGFTVGTTYYYYYDVDSSDNNGFELLLGLDVAGVGITAQTLLEDTLWGNTGDTYLKASYSYALPKDFSLDTALGLYFYKDSGDFEAGLSTTEEFGFRHFDIGLSKAIGETGATASMNYIVGGENRSGQSLKNKVVFGITYGF